MAARSKNFCSLEDEVLTRGVENRKHILFASFSPTITKSRRDFQWDERAAAVNKVSRTVRNVHTIKQRWKNLKATTKKSLGDKFNRKHWSKTGGGETADPLTSHEERMLGIIQGK